MRRWVGVPGMIVGCGALLVMSVAPAGAQDDPEYPPGTCALSLSVSVAERGQTVLASTVNCTSPFDGGATVTLELLSNGSIFLTTTEANDAGQFSNVPFVVPQQATLGPHTVQASGDADDEEGTLVLTAPLTVVAPGPPGPPGVNGPRGPAGPETAGAQGAAGGGRAGGALAFTGSDSLPLLWLALILLTIGTALVLAARRRAEVRRRGVAA
jgi:hypothetical protein